MIYIETPHNAIHSCEAKLTKQSKLQTKLVSINYRKPVIETVRPVSSACRTGGGTVDYRPVFDLE